LNESLNHPFIDSRVALNSIWRKKQKRFILISVYTLWWLHPLGAIHHCFDSFPSDFNSFSFGSKSESEPFRYGRCLRSGPVQLTKFANSEPFSEAWSEPPLQLPHQIIIIIIFFFFIMVSKKTSEIGFGTYCITCFVFLCELCYASPSSTSTGSSQS
jgi:hypothetical protein